MEHRTQGELCELRAGATPLLVVQWPIATLVHSQSGRTITRSRLSDTGEGTIDAAEVGWRYIDEIAHRHQAPQTHINVAIYRARRQLAKLGLPGARDIVERRQGIGQIRFGIPQVTVSRSAG